MTRLIQTEHASRLLELIRTIKTKEILFAFTVKALSLKPRTLLNIFSTFLFTVTLEWRFFLKCTRQHFHTVKSCSALLHSTETQINVPKNVSCSQHSTHRAYFFRRRRTSDIVFEHVVWRRAIRAHFKITDTETQRRA